MLFCDMVYKDPSTGKRSLMGLFNGLGAIAFPVRHPQMAVFAELTNGRGSTDIKVVLVDSDEEREPLFEASAEIVFENPRQLVEFDFQFQNLTFPEKGEYSFQIFANSEFLAEKRLHVNQIPLPPRPPAGDI